MLAGYPTFIPRLSHHIKNSDTVSGFSTFQHPSSQRHPIVANIATRPFLSSASRRRRKVFRSPSSWSQVETGTRRREAWPYPKTRHRSMAIHCYSYSRAILWLTPQNYGFIVIRNSLGRNQYMSVVEWTPTQHWNLRKREVA